MQVAEPFQILAVVPIFTNLGAAILPMVLAAIGSAVAIVFRPRELLQWCREKPAAVLKSIIALALFGLCAFLAHHFVAGVGTQRVAAAQPHFDWVRIAENIIARESAGKIASTSSNSPLSGSNDAPHVDSPPAASSRSPATPPSAPEHLTLLWRFQPEETMFLARPAAFADRIYVAGCQSELGSYVGILAGLSAETGQPLWQVGEFGNEPLKPFFSSPALTADGKYLVIGQGFHQDRDCSLLCFDTSNGKLKWSVKTPLHIESSPVVRGDLAIVGAGAIEGNDGRPTSDPGFVFAVRISDGMQVWRQPVNDPESSPTIDEDGVAYIGSGFNGSAVVALRSEGDDLLREKNVARLMWRRGLDCPIIGVVLAGNLVLANGGNGDLVHSNRNARGLVSALDKATGEIHWSTQFADSVLGAVAVHEDRVFCPTRTGEIVALALTNGEQLWRTPLSGDAPILAGCVANGARVLAVSSDGYLGVLDAETGKLIEKVYLNDQATPSSGLTASTPLLHGDRVIVGSETGGIRCYVGAELGK